MNGGSGAGEIAVRAHRYYRDKWGTAMHGRVHVAGEGLTWTIQVKRLEGALVVRRSSHDRTIVCSDETALCHLDGPGSIGKGRSAAKVGGRGECRRRCGGWLQCAGRVEAAGARVTVLVGLAHIRMIEGERSL